MADPAATQDDETDDETAPLAEAFESIAAIVGENEFTARDLAETCVMLLDGNPLPAAIEAAGCKAATEPKQLGFWPSWNTRPDRGGFKLTQGAQAPRRWHEVEVTEARTMTTKRTSPCQRCTSCQR